MTTKVIWSIFISLFFTASINCVQAQSYKIELTISEVKDTSIILGYYFNKQIFVQDTAYTNSKGMCSFTGNKPLDQGLYVVYLPDKTYFDLLIGNEQNMKITAKKGDLINATKITGSAQSIAFLDYQRFLISKQKEAATIQDSLKTNEGNKVKTDALKAQLNTLSTQVLDYWKTVEAKYPNTFLTAFLKGLQDIEVPQFEAPANSTNPDSVVQFKRYMYYKNHYFDNVDLTDERLLRTPYLTDKIERFFTQTLVQIPDTLIRESHKMIAKTEPNPKTYKYMVQYLFNLFNESKIMGMDGVMADIGETYYLSGKADWADSTFLSKLEDRVQKIKPNMIGKVAADFKMQAYTGEFYRLSEVKAPITILIFWESDCGHCKTEVPKLKAEVWDKYADKGIKIVAVHTQDHHDVWVKFIEDHQLNQWINLSDPYNRSNYRNNYDIYSTPVIYLLDKDKKILAKRIGTEQIPGFLDNYFKIK